LIEEVCRQAWQLDGEREIIVTVPEVAVLGDRDAIKQIFLILLDNAVKYSQELINITAETSGAEVVIGVQDHGPGFAPDMLQHIFDHFYRGNADPKVPGFGLGLSIAKALVEGQNGTIAIESQPGSGSVVQVRLPLASRT
jgi:signal transduction histidine kinase